MSFKTDAEIAQSSTMRPIGEIAAKLGLNVDNIEPYGNTVRSKGGNPHEMSILWCPGYKGH